MTDPSSIRPLLSYVKHDDIHAPHFRCATCGEPISDPRAIVTQPDKYDGGLSGDVMVFHRGVCDPDHTVAWDHLDAFLTYLVFNSRVSADTLRGLLRAVEAREREER